MDAVGERDFRPDVEGLRAVAVLGVLAFHANVPLITGGYIGVDVFFVISGFLITGLLLTEITRTGRIGLADFYARRCRRLLPAVGVTIVGTMLAGIALMPPLQLRALAVDAVTAALSGANWRFISQQTDYLAESAEPSPLLHFWSLAVEEQFYLVWAPLLAGAVILARLLRARPITVVAATIVAVTLASFALSLWWTHTSGPVAYLSTPTRAWQLGVGAVAALTIGLRHRIPRAMRYVLGAAGAVAIVTGAVAFDDATAFPGTAGLLPVLGAAAVLYAGPEANRWLTTRGMRWIGRLSFSWYLWHWPVVVFAQLYHGGPLPWPVLTLLVTAAGLPAWLTLRFVEQPLRRHPTVLTRPARGLAVGATAMVVPLTAALLTGNAAMASMERDEDKTPELDNVLAAPADPDSPTSGMVSPAPHRADEDRPDTEGCQVGADTLDSPRCLLGEDTGGGRIVLFGDSHAAQWLSAVREIADERGMAVEMLTKNGCPAADMTVVNRQTGQEYTKCDTWRENTIDRINSGPEPELIITTSINGRYTDDQDEWNDAWNDTIDALEVDSPIAYLRSTPRPGTDVPTCMSGASEDWDRCAFDRETALPTDSVYNDVISGDGDDRLAAVDLNPVLCPEDTNCPAAVDGALLYRDDSHLSDTAVRQLSGRLEHELQSSEVIDKRGDTTTPPSPSNWSVEFRDDFDGPDLGDDDWNAEVGNWPEGEGSLSDSSDNVAVDGAGNLAITPRQDADGWTSASLSAPEADLTTPDGGVLRTEASIRLPDIPSHDGDGLQPRLRMLTALDDVTAPPRTGDVALVTQDSGLPSVMGTVAAEDDLDSEPQDCEGCQSSFHTYSVEIDDDRGEIRWYLDGKRYHRVSAQQLGAEGWDRVTGSDGSGINVDLTVDEESEVTEEEPLLIDHVAVYTTE